MSQDKLNKLELFDHYSIFAYPFIHKVANNQQKDRLRELSENWESWWSRIDTDEDIAYILDNTYFFLPYIRKLIFPETNLLSKEAGEKYSNWVNQIKNIGNKQLHEINGLLPPRSILHLTLKKESISQFQNFTFVDKEKNQISADILWIDSVIFPTGIGFLLFKTQLAEDFRSINNLIELNQSFRNVHPFNIHQTLPKFKFNDDKKRELTVKQLINTLLNGFVSEKENYTESEAGQVYGEKCQIFSFVGINNDNSNLENLDCGEFSSPEDLLLYELGTCTNLYDSVCKTQWRPSKKQLKEINDNNIISNWECWSGISLRDSVVFLARTKGNFNQFSLPFIVEDDYLPLYLYSLYQKYQLYLFSDKLMQKGLDLQKSLREMRSLTNHIFTFRNRYWFNEVTRKPLGNEIYKRFKYGLGIFEAYDSVNEEVADLKGFYEEKQNRRIQNVITVLTFVFVPLSAVIGMWGMNFIKPDDGNWARFLVSCAIALFLFLGPYLFYKLWKYWKYSRK